MDRGETALGVVLRLRCRYRNRPDHLRVHRHGRSHRHPRQEGYWSRLDRSREGFTDASTKAHLLCGLTDCQMPPEALRGLVQSRRASAGVEDSTKKGAWAALW